jgi:outer membrane protein assembly factor BamB
MATDEVMRVLCPNGVAYVKENGRWTKTIKPRPKEIDEWTHFLHEASNNAVAQDTQVGPPRRLKWVSGPLWSRSHEFISSVAAMVSAGGRVFYVVDEGLTSVTDEPLPERWTLICRDAFNGVLLWKRSLPEWRDAEWRSAALRARPAGVPRRIVADSRRLYVTLGHRAPLEILDPATGETLRTIKDTDNTQEVLLCGRTLVLRLAEPRARNAKPSGWILAADPDTADVHWRVRADRYVSQSLAADKGRVIYSDGSETMCLTLADGKELWRQSTMRGKGKASAEKTFILLGDFALEADAKTIVARSAKTGETLWTTASGGKSMRGRDLFVAQSRVWHAISDGIVGHDLATGKPTKVIDPSCVQSAGHHLRCYRSKATERFLITQFRGAEFISLTDDNHASNDWIRGACRYGVMPCNGLLYVPPNPCFCYPGVKLTGFNALAPADGMGRSAQKLSPAKRIERGPAYDQAPDLATSSAASTEDWPSYRHDGRRTGATSCQVGPQVLEHWRVRLRGRITPPVISCERVYVATKDEHTLNVFHAENGRTLWQFTAAGRIDSPPSVCGGLVLFGCADGSVYCLRATDGELVWRFKAAPSDQRIVAFGQLESPWRVHGSVLLKDGIAYCTAGRSTFLLHLWARPKVG